MMQWILLVLWATAGSGSPALTAEQQAELPKYFGFGTFEIYKLQPAINHLRLADLNGDGRTDILVWNPYKSRFDLFYQDEDAEPRPIEDTDPNPIRDRGSLRRAEVPVSRNALAVAVAEVTGDQRPDIVFFGEPQELVILPQREDGGFGPSRTQRIRVGTPRSGGLATGDFNHDGRTDVALLGPDTLLIFHQEKKGGLAKPIRLVHGIRNPLLTLDGDFNGDGRDDLVIGCDDTRHGVYVCLQETDGTLAALRPIRVPKLRSITVVPRSDSDADDMLSVEYVTGRLKLFRWQRPTAGLDTDWPIRQHSYPTKSGRRTRPLTLGDVDRDGLIDCVTVDPETAQFVLFRGGKTGLRGGEAFPGFRGATDVFVGDLEGDGNPEVFTVSDAERTIGVSRYAGGRLTFPTGIPVDGEPLVAAMGARVPGTTADCMVYITRIEDGPYRLVVMRREQQELDRYELTELDDDPAAIRLVDINQDGRNDLLLFVRFGAPLVLLQNKDGAFAPAEAERAALLKEATPAQFAAVDIDGDGGAEVLFAQENLVRALRIEGERWVVVDQFNAGVTDADIAGVAALPGEDQHPTLVFYERRGGELLVQQRRADGTYGLKESLPVGNFDLFEMTAVPLGAKQEPAILLAGTENLAVVVPDSRAPTFVEQQFYETDERGAWPSDASVGDLNHDGVRDTVLLDMGKSSLEILTTLPSGEFVRALRFQVFEGRRFTDAPEAQGEPREMRVGDVTGDNIDDIVLIVHDRLIIYPGQ